MSTQISPQKAGQSKELIGAGILTAIAASLCCITPVLALIAGASGMASTFSWLEPARPYLMSVTLLVLGFAWYQKFKPRTKEEIECACEEDAKPSFWQSKKFLGIVTVFALLMLAFPYYAHTFYPQQQDTTVQIADSTGFFIIEFEVEGMTCTGCEHHIENALNQLEGVYETKASYQEGNTIVTLDSAKITVKELKDAINKTGYKVIGDNDKKP